MKQFFAKRHNKMFYTTLVAQILIAVQLILAVFGYEELLSAALQNKIIAAVNAVLVVLATFGVVNDPKQGGLKD